MFNEWCQASGAWVSDSAREVSLLVSAARWSVGIWEGTHDDANHHKLSFRSAQPGDGRQNSGKPLPVFRAVRSGFKARRDYSRRKPVTGAGESISSVAGAAG